MAPPSRGGNGVASTTTGAGTSAAVSVEPVGVGEVAVGDGEVVLLLRPSLLRTTSRLSILCHQRE